MDLTHFLKIMRETNGSDMYLSTGAPISVKAEGTLNALSSTGLPPGIVQQIAYSLMNEAQIGLAGKQTAIGDAIGLTIKRLQSNPEQSRVVILLTDGANTAGEVEPLKAAELAQQSKVKIYTIGLGADAMEVASFFGTRQVNPSRDLDETTLKKMAELTGGHYFRAKDSNQLEQIYALIDELEPTEKDPEIFRPQTNVYYWPLAAALMISFLMALQGIGFFHRVFGRFNQSSGKVL